MAWSAVSSAVTTLGKLLTEEATYLWGVEEQVDRLQTEMKWMQSFLKDAEARRGESERVRMWVSEIRDLAYDAEDVVEAFALKIASKRKTCLSKCACMVRDGWMLHKTRSEIEKIIAKITDLTRRLETYGVKPLDEDQAGPSLSSLERRQELRRPYPHIVDDHIVGVEDDINKLVSVLLDDQTRVVSICGMGGLGKTTLAKRVYHHSHVRNHFNHFAWVYVSQLCQRRKVWEETLSGLISSDERGSKHSDEKLAERLFKFLKDKKCLVILDDIWSTQAWDSINAAFPTSETRSKILLTSRNKEVASNAASRCYLHELECLKEEDSWELFRKIAFPNTDQSPEYRVDAKLEKLGKEMIKHCAGLPLAIIVLGGILANKHSTNEWQIVYEDVKSYIKKGKGKGTEDVLALSYDDMPPHLKPCFLYLSHFPEDYEMHAYRLIQLWVAEGVVSSQQDERNGGEVILEDVAECYLNELVERCMIQGEKRDVVSGKIKTCRMHDLMRELCLSKAREENFLYIFDHSNVKPDGNCINVSPTIRRVRRVAAQRFVWVQTIKNPHLRLRSLLFFDGLAPPDESLKSLPKMLQSEDSCIKKWLIICILFAWVRGALMYIFNNFKLLRVLDIEEGSAMVCKLYKDIGNLIHLRFLNLRNAEFFSFRLPSSLGNLRCLRSLDLRVSASHYMFHIQVPNVLWKLEQLRHLYLPARCNDKTELKLDTLRNLLTLVNFSTAYCSVEDLQCMIKLRELQICWSFYIKDLKEDLDENPPIIGSKCLRSLTIVDARMDPTHLSLLLSNCPNLSELSSYSGMEKLPDYHHFSSDIAYIHLHNFHEIHEDPMPTLEKLPNLRILKFDRNTYQGKEMVCSAQRFLRLDSLILKGLHKLEEWKVEEGAMPALRHLEVVECQRLKMLPEGLKFITTLKELKIAYMPKGFTDRVVEGGEDFYKVHHIPSIIFHNFEYEN